MTNPIEQSRKEFSDAMREKFGWNALPVLDNKNDYTGMVYQHVFYAWQGWQAARAPLEAQLHQTQQLLEDARKSLKWWNDGKRVELELALEKAEKALSEEISTLERDGDEWNICPRLRAALSQSDKA